MNSALCIGFIRHSRFQPIQHQFKYPMFMPFIDLDELDLLAQNVGFFSLKKWGIATFYPPDYMNGASDIKRAAQQKIYELTGEMITGRVMLLCHLRYLGVYFSPVNFYYLYDEKNQCRYLLAEVSNTPWNERHYYAIPMQKRFQHAKAFHVSPFNPIQQEYHWRLKSPSEQIRVHLEVHQAVKIFDASLVLKRRKFTTAKFGQLLKKYPLFTFKILCLIYWQAFKLWIKGAIYHHHPSKLKD